jgi:acyl dehydratase
MAVSRKHILQQGPVIAALGRVAWEAAHQKKGAAGPPPQAPGEEIRQTVPPRPNDLVRSYLRAVGGDVRAYRGQVPGHLFPQWGFPLLARTLEGMPYPMARVLNGGCRIEFNAPIPAGEALELRARLDDVDDNGKRAVLRQKLVTGTATQPEALVAYEYAIVPLGGGSKKKNGKATPKKKKEKPRVPEDVRELARWRLGPKAGLDFAILTGDFNPVHWIKPYARAAGFKSTILHGFSTLARAIESMNATLFAGRIDRIASIDARFTRPLLLPAKVGLYIDGNGGVFVGDAPGGPAYMTGTYELR